MRRDALKEPQGRTDWDEHARQVRAANRARYAATRRLVAENRPRFDVLYAEEGALTDPPVTPRGPRSRSSTKRAIKAQLDNLQQRLFELDGDGD